MNKVLNLTDEREAFLDQLISDLNGLIKIYDEYAVSLESSHAEYAQTLGYGDGEIELDRLTDEAKALVDLIPKGKRREALQECSDLQLQGVYIEDNQIFSVILGELEHQIDGEILDQVNSLSAEEFEYVTRKIDGYMSERHRDLVYTGHDYDVFAMILDEEKLAQWLKDQGIEVSNEN